MTDANTVRNTDSDDDFRANRSGGVQSVERAFEILELIASSDGETTLKAISAASGMPPPTIHRLLRTLVGLGYVNQSANRSYLLAPRLISLGEKAHTQLGMVARPELSRLVEVLGESANMAVLDADMIVYVAQVPSRHSMRMFTEVGRRVHPHNTGVGKAILASLPESRVREIIDRSGMPASTPKSISTMRDLLVELELTRARGFAMDDGEQEVGVRCFAVVVPEAPVPAAISISGPEGRIDEQFRERAVPLIQTAAKRVSDALGS
ncbi:IclR family transcriptional regulator [Humibacter ginsengisoli]